MRKASTKAELVKVYHRGPHPTTFNAVRRWRNHQVMKVVEVIRANGNNNCVGCGGVGEEENDFGGRARHAATPED